MLGLYSTLKNKIKKDIMLLDRFTVSPLEG